MSWPKCPECKARTKVVDSRPLETAYGAIYVRRRYQCYGKKAHRWTTREEKYETGPVEPVYTIGLETLTMKEWSKKLGISRSTTRKLMEAFGFL